MRQLLEWGKNMRPKSILLFERLFLSNMVVSVVAVFVSYGALRAEAVSRGASAAGPLLGIFLTLIVDLPLWYFVARRASRVAQWVLIVFYVFGFLTMIPMLARFQALGALYAAMTALSSILSIAAIVMLFRQDARTWFAHRGGPSPTDPLIFE